MFNFLFLIAILILILSISGRADLRIGVSEAKFDLEADFDVKKSLAPPKSEAGWPWQPRPHGTLTCKIK